MNKRLRNRVGHLDQSFSEMYADINPLAILPELKVEDASIHLAEALVKVNHTVPQPLVHGQVGGGSQKPAVAQLSLVDVKPISSSLHEPGLPSKFPRSPPFQVVPTLAEEHGGPICRELRVFPEDPRFQTSGSQLLEVLSIKAPVNHNRLRLVKFTRSDP